MREQEASKIKNPFPGLRPFNTNERIIFFGRDGLSDTLLQKLRDTRFATVVGTSGSGKSSLVKAGLLPVLGGGFMRDAGSGWRIALFRPVNRPIGNLAQALYDEELFGPDAAEQPLQEPRAAIEKNLRRSSLGLIEVVRQARMSRQENLLIVVDQFEELFRFEPSSDVGQPEEEASAFVKLLLEATKQTEFPIYVILTMRSEYLGDSARFWGLPEAINRGQFLIPRMDDDERREAIEGPVRVFDAKMSAPLVNRLLNDVGDDPARLPILQHALMRTWDYWLKHRTDSEAISIKHYDNPAVGGMKRALSLHADEAYQELSDTRQVIAEKMFKRLTEKSRGSRGGRLPTSVREIQEITEASEAEVVAVIDAFRIEGRSFLLPTASQPLTSETLIDISHESLISGWDRLAIWVEKEADSAKIYGRLVDDALDYPMDKGLRTNPELSVALIWRTEQNPNEAWARRYRSQFGKALAGDRPPRHPEWAEPDATDFGIATKYLDLSRDKHERAEALKERKRRSYLITLAVVAGVFLTLALVAFGLYRTAARAESKALQAQNAAVADKIRAEDANKLAQSARGEALLQKQNADDRATEVAEAKKKVDEALTIAQKERANAVHQAAIAAQRFELGQATDRLLAALTTNTADAKDEQVEAYQSMWDFYGRKGLANPANQDALDMLTVDAILKDDKSKVKEAFPYFARASKRSSVADPNLALARVNIKFAQKIIDSGNRDKTEAKPFLLEGINRLDDENNAEEKALAKVQFGDISDNPYDAVRAYLSAAPLFHKKGDYAQEASTHEKLGDASQRAHEGKLAGSAYETASELFLRADINDQSSAARVLNKLGNLAMVSSPEEAISYFQRAADASHAKGDRTTEGGTLKRIGDIYVERNNDLEALHLYEKAHQAYDVKNVGNYEPELLIVDGRVLEAQGSIYEKRKDNEQARSIFELAINRYRRAGDWTGQARGLNKVANLTIASNPDEAISYLQRAASAWNTANDHKAEGETFERIGDIFVERNKREAINWYEKAIALYRQTGDRVAEARVQDRIKNLRK